MSTFDIIKSLANEQGKSVKDVALELGFGENVIYKWKNQNPTIDKLEKVADYFGVSIDYLTGRTTDKYSHFKINKAENPYKDLRNSKEIKDLFNELNDVDKKTISQLKDILEVLKKTPNK